MIQLLLAVYSGFTHAFEADHLLAVSSLVSNRKGTKHALKEGLYWGLGHTSTIILIGLLVILLRLQIHESFFHYLEACVGLLLILLATFRLNKFWNSRLNRLKGPHSEDHSHAHPHHLAYFVGLVHGLAGSGALIVLVMTQIQNTFQGMLYLSIFGLGSILGMFVAAGLLSFPFTKDWAKSESLQNIVILSSSALCIIFGCLIVHENLL